jgi:GT2 family glycosyltransferase
MKLSVIILCWNDLKVIADCLRSIYANTHSIAFEVIVSDNGSTDGSIEFIRNNFPQVNVIENGRNLRFAKANNVGIRASRGEYLLILNPDTIIHEGTLDKMVSFADQHVEAGAFGCRVLNVDGTYQESSWPYRTIRGDLITALYLRPLAHLSRWFTSDTYVGWKGESVKSVDWVSGCCILARRELVEKIGGFDEQFFYYFEDMDLCQRIRKSGQEVLYFPGATITHLGGQSTKKRFPAIGFVLDGEVTRYLYYYKYYGEGGIRRARRVSLVAVSLRRFGYRLLQVLKPTEARKARLDMLRILSDWQLRVDPLRLVQKGEEPDLGINLAGRVLER